MDAPDIKKQMKFNADTATPTVSPSHTVVLNVLAEHVHANFDTCQLCCYTYSSYKAAKNHKTAINILLLAAIKDLQVIQRVKLV